MENRIIWADYVKAFTIWLMVLGHSSLHNAPMMNYITSFHVPVFFLISGFFEKGKERPFTTRIKKGWKQIIVPFIFFNVIGLFSCWVSPYLHPELYYNIHGYKLILNALTGIFLMDDFVTPYSYLPVGPTWFLISLFICKVLFGCYVEIINVANKYKYILMILFLFIVYLLYQPQIHFASFDSAALAFPFYILGFYINKSQILIKRIHLSYLLMGFILSSLLLYYLSQKNGFVGVDGGNYGQSIFLFYFNAILGSLMIISLSKIILLKEPKNKFLSSIGENTLTILGVHISMLYIIKFCFVKIFSFDMNNISTLTSIIISIMTLMLSLYIAFVLNKYCPKLVGKQ